MYVIIYHFKLILCKGDIMHLGIFYVYKNCNYFCIHYFFWFMTPFTVQNFAIYYSIAILLENNAEI